MSTMRFGSVCSGIEAASVAWNPLGWTAAWLAEIDPFANAVLDHRYPGVPNLGDFTKIRSPGAIDLLVGGTPCQSFSVAGKRLGLDDPRGNLAIEFLRLARDLCPEWLVWENVFGVLSSNGGRDLGAFLGMLGELGYGWAYRVLDAQYVRVDGFGRAVPQRRRRVFVVGHLGDWRRAVAVLFERESLSGNPPPSRTEGEDFAPDASPCLRACSNSSHRADSEAYVAHTLRADGFDASEDGTGRGIPLVPVGVPFIVNAAESCAVESHARKADVARCLDSTGGFTSSQGGTVVASFNPQAGGKQTSLGFDPYSRTVGTLSVGQIPAVAAFDVRNITSGENRSKVEPGQPCPTLHADPMHAIIGPRVRRLTPLECERLQGLPDGYTLVPYRKKPAKDGPRYKAIGNSIAIPPLRWLGMRIDMVRAIKA